MTLERPKVVIFLLVIFITKLYQSFLKKKKKSMGALYMTPRTNLGQSVKTCSHILFLSVY